MNALAKLTRLTGDPLASNDGALLDAFLAGDQGAFAALVRRYAGLVFATCRRVLRHQQDAEDAFQATFLVLARRAGDVWPREAVGSWLFGVANRVALKARAVRTRQQVRERPLEDVVSPEPGAPDFDLADAVHRAVAKLPDVYRSAVVACDLQGLSRKEAAERLGWTEGTLSGRLARARGLLAARLGQLGYSLPAGGVVAVLGASELASAAFVQATINLVTGSGAGVSAPVAVLTEGVVQSMAILKFKAAVAVVFTACALAYGAFAASGAGDGSGQQSQSQTQGAPKAPAAPKPVEPPAKPVVPPQKPAADLAPLQGDWHIVSISEGGGEGGKVGTTDGKDWVLTINGGTLKMPYKVTGEAGWKQREYKIAVDGTKTPKTIDLIVPNEPVGRGIYEFVAPGACAKCHADVTAGRKGPPPTVADVCDPELKTTKLDLRLALSIDGKRPTKFGGEGVLVFELKRPADPKDEEKRKLLLLRRYEEALHAKVAEEAARKAAVDQLRHAMKEAEEARARLAEAQANAAVAQAQVDKANEQFRIAQDKLAAAEKAVEAAKKPQPAAPAKDVPVFTVHVRTLTAAEKVIRVKATGKETVLEALVYAADDVPLKTDSVSVWVVRGEKVLTVDPVAIIKNGITETNYVLNPGDKLFVQVKAGK